MEVIELNEYKNGRILVRLADDVSFILYKKEAALYDLKVGEDLCEASWIEIRQEILVKRAKRRVMYLLQKKDYTEKQLREKLGQNEYPPDVIEEAIEYVKSFHYVDDSRYASSYVHLHQGSKSVLQLKMDLKQRGVSKDEIEQAIEEELSVSQEEVIKGYLRKKQYNPSQAEEREKRRVYQFLMRKGFKSSDILRCMNIDEFT